MSNNVLAFPVQRRIKATPLYTGGAPLGSSLDEDDGGRAGKAYLLDQAIACLDHGDAHQAAHYLRALRGIL